MTLIYLQLPSPICTHQDLNYTIIIVENGNGSNVNSTQYHGPFNHTGPGLDKHNIESDIDTNKEYSARVVVSILSHMIISHDIQFSELLAQKCLA